MTTLMLLIVLAAPAPAPAPLPPPLITIDDGPDHQHHVRTLKLLQRHNVKAIWFVNGFYLHRKKNRQLLKQIVKAGHTIAQHTYSHPYPCKITAQQFRWQLRRNERIVNRTLGWPKQRRMKLYRPPFGHRCHLKIALRLGYRKMFWHNADIGHTTASMIRTVRWRHRLKPPRRSILLFHRHNHKLAAVLKVFFPVPIKKPPRP